jgi:hypothetical protein
MAIDPKLRKALTGISGILVTPFDGEDRVAPARLKPIMDRAVGAGVHILVRHQRYRREGGPAPDGQRLRADAAALRLAAERAAAGGASSLDDRLEADPGRSAAAPRGLMGGFDVWRSRVRHNATTRSTTMTRMTPSEFAREVGAGLLSFPVTCFHPDFSFDERTYRDHIAWLGKRKVAGLFAAGGTGEFFSLSLSEVEKVVQTAVAENNGRVPVIAGTGYGAAIAKDLAGAAERAGADGLLLLPTYLTEAPPEGIAAHVEAVCKSTKLACDLLPSRSGAAE